MRSGPRTTIPRAVLCGIGAGLLPLALIPVLTSVHAAAPASLTATVAAAQPAGAPHPARPGGAATASAADGADVGAPAYLHAEIGPVNHSGARGSATAVLRADVLHIRIVTHGLAPGLAHAQHLHIGASHTCPGPDATGGGVDGQVRSADAKKTVGPIAVSLTTRGDTSPDSSYALDRFPVGDAGYERAITLTPRIAAQLRAGDGVIEQHGVDPDRDGRYGGGARSDVDPRLPQEASNTAACGRLLRVAYPVPVGGAAAGAGWAAGAGGAA
ncbi:conserved exported hypothetical protein [Frankia canadensis]|uniref:CHRD domain-containing protein n=1 Tax=Frankia canadensis TaxID=1836972 RepID=A0A2I2L0Y5_9ACTN|nr:CHRD domain-containing protein [Frankia canadensis]SNQ51586.1 conserved exported hypothetical protein [Frankia canadensis]SOU58876.1 conserved exported hypothetical protein [Frankia canadensis]